MSKKFQSKLGALATIVAQY